MCPEILQIDEQNPESAIPVLRKLDDLYFNGEPSASDSEYDAFRKMVQSFIPNHPYFLEVGSPVRGEAVPLPYPMASLDQVHLTEIAKWKANHPTIDEYLLTDKMDGASVLLVFEKNAPLKSAFSRGDALEGADITRHLSKVELPTCPCDMVIRAEVEISNKSFDDLQDTVKSSSGEPYKNPRNMISGLMNRKEAPAEVYPHISVICYQVVFGGPDFNTKKEQMEYLKSLGFTVPHMKVVTSAQMNDPQLIEYVQERKTVTEFDIDGIVAYVNDLSLANSMDIDVPPGSNPKSAFKYKILEDDNIKTATVKWVEWTKSKHAYFKPVAVFEPIELQRVTIERATAFNAKFIKDNNIGPGSKIQITRSGDVIPFIIQVVEPSPTGAQLPSEDFEWTETGVDIFSPHALMHDSDVKVYQLVDFCESMDFPLIREGSIRTLMSRNYVNNCEDIITTSMLEYIAALGANGSKIYDGIHKKLSKIELWTLMGSVPFFGRGVGRKKFKKLIGQIGSDYTEWTIEQIAAADEFDVKTATKIINGIPQFVDFFDTIKEYLTIAETASIKDGALSGEKICVTGFRDQVMNTMIENCGGTLQTGVSGKTTILVCANPDTGSGKAKKAKDLNDAGKSNIRIVGREEFQEELNGYI